MVRGLKRQKMETPEQNKRGNSYHNGGLSTTAAKYMGLEKLEIAKKNKRNIQFCSHKVQTTKFRTHIPT